MKRIGLLIAMLFLATQVFSQGWGYSNQRIAISADGNNQPDPNTWGGSVTASAPAADAGKTFTYNSAWQRGDEDDWSATPAALAMLANANLEAKLVHYSYNNFIGSPAHTSETNVMKEGVEGALEFFTEFDASVFFDVSANNTAAINHLAEQIKISTASDPLYFVQMGPSEFLYQALVKVKADGKEDAINHLYIISHSNYNDNHIRRAEHHRIEHILNDFPVTEGTNFKRIIDQNQSADLNNGWSSSAVDGVKNWTPYYFLRDHFDPSCKYLWDRLNIDSKSKPDISDAGLVWFLLNNDENGNPSKLKTKFINGVKPGSIPKADGYCPAIDVYETEGLLVFEAERIELKGDWKLGTDEAYASGGQYIYYDGPNSYQSQNASNIISYSFTINTPGTYTVKWFGRQNEEERGKVEGQQGTDLSNDVWLKFPDGIAYWGTEQTTSWFKFYGRSDPGFWMHGIGEINHAHNWVNIKVEQAGTYTMEICGRSHGYQIDKIVMATSTAAKLGDFSNKTEAQANKYWSETGTVDPNCENLVVEGCETIVAKDFTDLDIEGYDPATIEWRVSKTWEGAAKEVIKCNGTNGVNRPIAAEVVYNGTAQGNARYKVHAMQEPDGECTYAVYVNETKVGEQQISSSYDATHDIEDEKLRNEIEELIIDTKAPIKPGDIIRVTSNQVTNGKVPEGTTTATARGRWYALEVCVDKNDFDITEKVALVSPADKVSNAALEIPITVSYGANEQRDLKVELQSPDGTTIDSKTISVERGVSSTNVIFTLASALAVADGYKVISALCPVGEGIESSIMTKVHLFDVVDGPLLPTEDLVDFIDAPVEFSKDLLEFSFKVSYSATQERDVNIELKDLQPLYITNAKITVPAGEGEATIVVKLTAPLEVANGYSAILTIRPVNGDWQTNIAKKVYKFNIVDSSLSVDKPQYNALNIYPSPAEDILNISCPEFVNSKISIIALSGQLIATVDAQSEHTAIDVSSILPGIYILSVVNDNFSTQRKIIIR